MEKEKALEFWDQVYGSNCKWKQDCFGTWMYRDDYGNQNTLRRRDPSSNNHITMDGR